MSTADDGIRVGLSELLRQRFEARRLALGPGRRSRALNAGGRRSRLRGRGVDFQESRQYQPGDDIRSIDWRVTARSGTPHTKVYAEERNRPVHLLLDANPSLFFGTRVAFKSVVAARLAALLAWFTIQRGDRIGALLFAGERCQVLPPGAGQRSVMVLLKALLDWYAPAETGPSRGGLGAALTRLQASERQTGQVILVSDFALLESDLERQLTGLRRQHEVLACRILDPLELELPPAGRYGISDGRQIRLLDLQSRAARIRHQAQLDLRQQRLTRLLRHSAIPLLTLTATDDPVRVLQQGGLRSVS